MTILADGAWWDQVVAEAGNPWQAVLAAGQLVFFSRFLVQWIATERKRRVVVPVAFWWLSLAGAAVSLAALVALRQPVLILAQVVGMVVYGRNLVIHNRQARASAGAP
jgi:lipid-A-disaccharide synthase-like uncharacterized protein